MHSECFMCSRKLNTRNELDFQQNLGKNVLKSQLSIFFLLTKLLRVPSTSCAEYLSAHGNPSTWLGYCSHCALTIHEAQVIYEHLSKLKAKLKSIQRNVEHMLVKLHKKIPKQSELSDFNIGDSIREEIIHRLIADYSIEYVRPSEVTAPENNEFDISDVKLETRDELFGLFSDDTFNCLNSPEACKENANESQPCSLLEDNQDLQSIQAKSINESEDSSSTCVCGKKFKYLRSLLRHKTLCDISKMIKSSELQLKDESFDTKNDTESRVKGNGDQNDGENETSSYLVKTTKIRRQIARNCKKDRRKVKRGRKQFICEFCNKKLKRIRDLKRHLLAMHFQIYGDKSPKNFPCSACEQSFTTEIFKNAHFRAIHRGLAPYRCLLCRSNFSRLSFYEKHMSATHVKGGEISCEQCEEKFCDQETLGLHKRITHEKDPRPFFCPICQKSFISPRYLKEHEANHFAEKAFTCEFCSSSFITSDKLESHQRKFHYEQLNLEPLICEKCPTKRRFGSEKELRYHQKTNHKTSFNFYCEKCPRGFMKEDGLEYHMTTKHPSGKKFACSFCGKCFQMNKHRRDHIRLIHDAAYKLQCPSCPKCFKGKETLRRHIMYVHSESERVQCPYCPLMFKVSKYLDQHIRNKHDEDGGREVVKNIPCPHCSMMFSDNSYLINHVRKKHPEENLQNISISIPATTDPP